MAGKRAKPVNPFLAYLCKDYRNPDGSVNLKAAALGLGIPYSTILCYADINDRHPVFNALIEAAKGFNISESELIHGLLAAAQQEESA